MNTHAIQTNLIRFLTLGVWTYTLFTLYQLAQSFGLFAALLMQGFLMGLLLYFSVFALLFADKSPRMALFAVLGCILIALVL
ncbi:MAG: hypothetical protein R3E89_15635 [Thiolinea sp.]